MALNPAAACAVLGVSIGAPFHEIRRAYRQRLLSAHPDKGGDPEAFRRIRRAWELLATRNGLSRERRSLGAVGSKASVVRASVVGRGRSAASKPPCSEGVRPKLSGSTRASSRRRSARLSSLANPAENLDGRGLASMSKVFKTAGDSRPQPDRDPLEAWRRDALAAATMLSNAEALGHAMARDCDTEVPRTVPASRADVPQAAQPPRKIIRHEETPYSRRPDTKASPLSGPSSALLAATEGGLSEPLALDQLVERLRATPAAERRDIISRLPEHTRQALQQHMRDFKRPSTSSNGVKKQADDGCGEVRFASSALTSGPSSLLSQVCGPSLPSPAVSLVPPVLDPLQTFMALPSLELSTQHAKATLYSPHSSHAPSPSMGPSPRSSPRSSPRLSAALEAPDFSLPEALPGLICEAPREERCEILEAVRGLGQRLNALLAAPDIAAIAKQLREVDKGERRVLIQALPVDTQLALQDHMLAERRSAAVTAASAVIRSRQLDHADMSET